jgi:hypothetical protein
MRTTGRFLSSAAVCDLQITIQLANVLQWHASVSATLGIKNIIDNSMRTVLS